MVQAYLSDKDYFCASAQGKPLYETLGWTAIGQYSKMVKTAI